MATAEVEKDQLEALRNRVEDDYRRVEDDYRRAEENYHRAEENYRLDIAAIEHLQRRFSGTVSSISTSEYSAANGFSGKTPATMPTPQTLEPLSAAKANEEWEIFKSVHK